jgi:chemotaxis protein methyltransferase CheR
MDLILCRNVFVYFEYQYISQVLKKFAKTLRPGGYLMTGHAEVHNHVMHDFQPKVFPESVVYQAKNVPGEEPGKIESLIASASKASEAFGESGKGGSVDYDSRQLLPRRTVLASFANGNLADMGSRLTPDTGLVKMVGTRYVEGDWAGKDGSFSHPLVEEKNRKQLI